MSLTTLPPPALSEDLVVDKKRKHVEELASSSTSIQRLWPVKPLFKKMI
jgi:hypothetical protein